jgi:osmoprotectant transport system substrate-binding protein
MTNGLGTAVMRLLTLTALGCAACSSHRPTAVVDTVVADESVTVASFDFAESEVLAEAYGQALRAAGYDVRVVPRLGPRELVLPALAQGLVELVPEYSGTALGFVSLGSRVPASSVSTTHDDLVQALSGTSLAALASAPAQNSNAIVVTGQTAARYGLRDISDLRAIASQLVFGAPPECPTRPLCLVGLEGTYGLRFKDFVPLDVGGPWTRAALEAGQVDVALLFTTDPGIVRDGLVVLEDDRHLQPAENIVPMVNAQVLQHWGSRLVERADAVSAKLTTDVLASLNAQVEAGESPATVAARWLASEGLS